MPVAPVARRAEHTTVDAPQDTAKKSMVGILLSGSAGLLCWSSQEDLFGGLAWMAGLPVLWMLMPSRRAVMLSVLAYYVASSPTSYLAVRNYFADWPAAYCTAVHLGFLAVLAVPWMLLPPTREGRPQIRLGGLLGALVLSTVPPLGVVSAWHPLLSAGWVWPGGGWWALALVLGCWVVVALQPSSRNAAVALLVLSAVGVATNLGHEDAKPVNTVAVDLSLPRATSYEAFGERLEVLNRILRARRAGHQPSLAVLPENALEEWKDATKSMILMALRHRLGEGPILAGTTITDDSGRWGGVVLLNAGQEPKLLRARQPLVLSLWHPWEPFEHYSASWTSPGVMQTDFGRLGIRVCSEEFSLFWMLVDQALYDPTALVVVGNHYWSKTVMHDVVQARHGRAAARLFGIPIVRSINRAPDHPMAPSTSSDLPLQAPFKLPPLPPQQAPG